MRKAPVGQFLIFITLWSLLVYYPISRWTWHWQGWSILRGSLDFAGGTAVHICSGSTVAAYAVFYALQNRNAGDFGARQPSQIHQDTGIELTTASKGGANTDAEAHRVGNRANGDIEPEILFEETPHNVNSIVLGTALLWIGWFGFNGGSALGANLRAVSACLATHVAACSGGSFGLLYFWFWQWVATVAPRPDAQGAKKLSVISFCDGAVTGLVAITPAAGFVSLRSSRPSTWSFADHRRRSLFGALRSSVRSRHFSAGT
jgi:ammonia channel protein AmtB